ncbi:MAG: 50S ribosomal protein L34e [Nanoarchaeota archaeon]|nr:50S ribosomal protein L34e [Nanoarchaeota archaeon]
MAGSYKSLTRKIIKRTLPGGNSRIFTPKRQASRVLQGVPRARGISMQRIPKSQRRPNRPYGGMFNTRITRAMIIQKAREKQ